MRSGSQLLVLVLAACLTIPLTMVLAQSGSQSDATRSSPSGNDVKLAIRGYCPVCLIEMKRWVPGTSEYSLVYDGHEYRFPGPKEMQMFQEDPAKYVPVLHGDCVVCLVKMGHRMPGDLNFGQFHGGRVYFFPSDRERRMFKSNPAEFADADLALNGQCAVCRVEMGEEVAGKPEFTVHYQGLRYQFPGPEQRDMFLDNPSRYSVPLDEVDANVHSSENSSFSEERVISIVGRTSCAGCEHGVKPLKAPDTLGLAIVADNMIYVIEDAHNRYPDLYKNRFSEQTARVAGKVLKSEKNIVWIQPQDIRLAP